MGNDDDLIGVGEAAAALGVTRRTVSRWLQDNPRLRRGGSLKRPKLDLDELIAFRGGLDPDRAAAGAAGGARAAGEPPELAGLKADKLREEVAVKRLEREEREGRLLPRAEVERAFFACGRRVRRKVELIETWAEELAAASGGDPAALRAALRDRLRGFQAELAETVKRLPLGAPDGEDPDGDDEESDDAADAA